MFQCPTNPDEPPLTGTVIFRAFRGMPRPAGDRTYLQAIVQTAFAGAEATYQFDVPSDVAFTVSNGLVNVQAIVAGTVESGVLPAAKFLSAMLAEGSRYVEVPPFVSLQVSATAAASANVAIAPAATSAIFYPATTGAAGALLGNMSLVAEDGITVLANAPIIYGAIAARLPIVPHATTILVSTAGAVSGTLSQRIGP